MIFVQVTPAGRHLSIYNFTEDKTRVVAELPKEQLNLTQIILFEKTDVIVVVASGAEKTCAYCVTGEKLETSVFEGSLQVEKYNEEGTLAVWSRGFDKKEEFQLWTSSKI